MARDKENLTSGASKGESSSAPASNAGSVAKASASPAGKTSSSSAAGSYSKSGSSFQSSKSISKAASNAKAAIAAGARHASMRDTGTSSTKARFGSGIDNSNRSLTGTHSQQGTATKAGVYAKGGLNPSSWGSSMLSPSRKSDDSALQKAIDDLTLPVDYEDRNIHSIDPDKDADESYFQRAQEFNYGRQLWAYNDTAGALTREYASSEEQLSDILDLMTHAQVYYNDAKKNDYKFVRDGEEVSAADEWKKLYDELERRSGWLTDVGQVQDLFTRYQNGEDVTLENVDTMAARAQARLDNPYNDEDAAMWQGIIGDLNNIWGGVNRKTAQNLQGQVDDLAAQLESAKNAALVAEQSENSLNFADVIVSDADRQMIKDKAAEARATTQGIYDQQMSVQAQLDQLNADYRARFMTSEVSEAINRLSLPERERRKTYETMMREANASITDPSQIVTVDSLMQQDQAVADAFENEYGSGAQYYNLKSRINGVLDSWANRTGEAFVNLAATGVNALDYAAGLDNVDSEALQAQAYATSPDMLTQDITQPTGEYAQQWNENGGNDGALAQAADKLESIADSMGEKAQTELAQAKNGLSKLGQFGVDLASTGLDVGFDALTGGGLYTMFARVMGSGIGEARRQGATAGQQFFYGLSQATIETFTEKLGDGLGGIYGKGFSGDAVEKAISRLASTDAGANFLRLLSGTVAEGGEEVISDLLNPFTNWIIDESARDQRLYEVDPSELLYDFLLGGAMGLLGQGIDVRRGKYAAKNAEIRQNDAEILEKAENAEATGEQLTRGELKDLEAAQSRQEQRQIKGGLWINPNGSISTIRKGANRHDTATNVLSDNFENAGYVNTTNADEDYNKATTGAETRAPSSDAEALAQNEAPEERPADRTGEEELQYEDEQNQRDLENEELQRWGGQADPKTGEPVMATETATGAQEASTQANTQENPQPSVKLEGNERGEAVTSEEAKADAKEVVGKLQNAVAQGRLNMKESVSDVKASDFQKVEGQSLVERVGNFFKGLGNKVKSAALGGQEVILDERGVKSDIAHGLGKAKAATFAAVPDVIANGKIIDTQKNWKGRGYDTQVIAGRISIDGKGAYVACVVTSVVEDGKNRFYLHEVVDANGNLIYSFDSMNKNAPAANIKTGVAENGITGVATGDTASIAQNPQVDNSTNSSTNVSQDGTIETKGGNRDGVRSGLYQVAGNQEQGQQVQPGGKQTISGDGREVYRPSFSGNEREIREQNEALKQRIAELEAAQQTQVQQEPAPTQEETQETPQETGRTPGRVKQSQSAFEQDVATKGERANTDAAMGEAEFLSRTNEARSRTADALTDSPEKADAQVQRLLQEDYVWNDDDVVIAQKLMFDMVKAIRDYQLKKNSKLSVDAFRKMTEQYNQLMTKHQQKLSAAGKELQANYTFSTGDKIVMKAAQTFLGFTKDGRFAGASVNAKNAKIYAGIEEASKRIQKAVDTEDVQGLAKICKDISDIRNVKKMFGPLGGYASEMESRVLERIAKGENAAENLENLAYGNLNAICDDVQPYKALNAAKTIRVMNMLSNTATIVNNLANNFAQGAVNKSMVNQALTQMAAKPFETLTGQQAISKAQRGKEANRAVRNAQAEALETATLMQMYGITEENGRLELNDRGMFNPNINAFEQTMSLYKFLTGMGVEATDKMQAAGILKSMELGIDADIKAGKIEAHTKEQRMQEARHEVNRLLYKDDNSTTALVQHIRDFLNKWSIGNDRVGTIGVGDITMAFAKIPANVVRARLAMTPEGALLQVAQYAKGVNKAKRMHAEVLAKGIVEAYQEQIDAANTALQSAYEMERGSAKDTAIQKAKSELSRLNRMMWTEAREACRGSVYRNLSTIAGNYNENMMFNEAVERAGYMNAKEMSQFEAAQLSRKIGRAATSAGMMVLGSVLRALGALRDFDQEPDDELRKMNSDKGYRGLMMNLSAIGRKNHEWKDGDLILDGEFLEVIAMPLTIGATAAEAAATAQDAKTWSWLKSMAGNGIAKTFEAVGDIPGMADAINMYESLTSAYNTDYDEKVNRLGAGLIQYAANTVPSFFMPNSISQATAGIDNKVRDVYAADTVWGQAANIFMNKFPGLRNKVPVSVDVWGNERTYGEGLWGVVNKMLLPGDIHVYRKNKYEAEIERMVKAGYGNATPKTTVNSSFEVGDEKYTMTAQEKLDYKAARNSQQRELFEAFIDSDYYNQLNDAERMKVFQSLKTSAERDAKQDTLDGRQLDVQITRDKWETELTDVNDQLQFLAAKQMANNVLDRDAEDMDYAAVDEYLTGAYKALDETQRGLLDSSFSRLDDMFEAKDSYGIGSEMFNTGYNIYKDYMSDEGRARVQGGYKDWEGSQMYTDIAKATGANEKQMDFFEKKFVLYNNNAVVPEKYNEFVDSGWSRDSAQSMVKAVADLTPTNGRKTVSYKQRLTAIATTKGLTEAQRWEAFFEYCPSSYTSVIRSMSNKKNSGYSYEKALRASGKWDA